MILANPSPVVTVMFISLCFISFCRRKFPEAARRFTRLMTRRSTTHGFVLTRGSFGLTISKLSSVCMMSVANWHEEMMSAGMLSITMRDAPVTYVLLCYSITIYHMLFLCSDSSG